MGMLSREEVQQLEDRRGLRLKFAAIDEHGSLRSDALEEYQSFFEAPPEGWDIERYPDEVMTRTESRRPAWQLSSDDQIVVAVEHETGIEFLLAGVAVNVASAAVVGLVTWAWKRWRGQRSAATYPKVDASLVIEIPRGDGQSAPPLRLVIPPPVEPQSLAHYLKLADAINEAERADNGR